MAVICPDRAIPPAATTIRMGIARVTAAAGGMTAATDPFLRTIDSFATICRNLAAFIPLLLQRDVAIDALRRRGGFIRNAFAAKQRPDGAQVMWSPISMRQLMTTPNCYTLLRLLPLGTTVLLGGCDLVVLDPKGQI